MKHVLQLVLERAGKKTRSYSGRFMFGHECLGVVLRTRAEIIPLIMQEISQNPLSKEDLALLSKALLDTKYDDMGKDHIVYWPEVAFSSENQTDINSMNA